MGPGAYRLVGFIAVFLVFFLAFPVNAEAAQCTLDYPNPPHCSVVSTGTCCHVACNGRQVTQNICGTEVLDKFKEYTQSGMVSWRKATKPEKGNYAYYGNRVDGSTGTVKQVTQTRVH